MGRWYTTDVSIKGQPANHLWEKLYYHRLSLILTRRRLFLTKEMDKQLIKLFSLFNISTWYLRYKTSLSHNNPVMSSELPKPRAHKLGNQTKAAGKIRL